MIKQTAVVSAVEAGLYCCGGGYIHRVEGLLWGFFFFLKMTSTIHEKLDSEVSLPIACAMSLQEMF